MSVGAIRAGRAMVEIFADSSSLARGLASARYQLARFAQSMRRMGTLQVVLGVGIAAPIALAVRQYALLEQKINSIRSLSGATVGQMRSLQATIFQIGMSTGRPFGEVAEGMIELSKAGVALKDIGAATRVIADFSRAAGIDMARATGIGVQVLTEFGLQMEHLPRVADVLQEMANATVSSVEDLGDGFRYAGQTAKLFGLSLEQTGSAIAYLQQSGLSASTAGTSFNQMLLQMVENVDKIEGALGTLRNAGGDFIPFEQILEKLQTHLKDMGRVERLKFLNDMFDVRGMRGAAALLENIEGWVELNEKAQNSAGASRRKAQEMAEAFVVSFEKMRNGAEAFAFAIGEVMDSDLRGLFDFIGNFAAGLGPFVKANGDAVRAVAKLAGALTVSGVAFFATGISLQLVAFAMEGFAKAGLVALAPLRGVQVAIAMIGRSAAIMSIQLRRSLAYVTAGFAALLSVSVASGRGVAAAVNIGARAAAAGLVAVAYSVARSARAIGVLYAGLRMAHNLRFLGAVAALVAGNFVELNIAIGAVAVSLVTFKVLAAAAAGAVIAIGGAIITGVSKSFGDLASSAKAIWPEVKQTAVTGWQGVADAVNAGDLSLAWKVFVSAAKTAFAQAMVVIGPWVDAVKELAVEIGTTLSSMFWSMIDAAKPAFNTIIDLAKSVIGPLSNIGESILAGIASRFPAIQSMFDYMAEAADGAGKRIMEALSAGELVKAWVIASSAIHKMMVSIASFWDANVAAPIRLVGEQLGSRGEANEILGQFRQGQEEWNASGLGPGEIASRRTLAEGMLNARTPEQLAEARARMEASRPAIEEEAASGSEAAARHLRAFDDALRLATGRLKSAGIMSAEEREAAANKRFEEIDADTEAKLAGIDKRRDEASAKRRKKADEESAKLQVAAGAAAELSRRKALEKQIADATTADELDAAQRELNKWRQATVKGDIGDVRVGEADASVDGAFISKADMQQSAKDQIASLDDDAARLGIGDTDKDAYRRVLERFQKRIDAAENDKQVLDALASATEESESITRRRGDGAVSPSGRTADELAAKLDEKRKLSDAEASQMSSLSEDGNQRRAEEALAMRTEAAARRRAGDAGTADKLDASASALEQAVDTFETAELQRKINEQRQGLIGEEDLRKKKVIDPNAVGAAAKPLDTVGGFMGEAFNRMGYGKNLQEQQAKDQKRAADGIDKLVGLVANGGGIFA